METNIQQTCQYCLRPIRGRSDKKFCNDACRNIFHNRNNTQQNKLVRSIKRILIRNRRILSELLAGRSTITVPRSTIMVKGFHFEFITHVQTNKQGVITYCCYDFAYKNVSESLIQICKPKSNI